MSLKILVTIGNQYSSDAKKVLEQIGTVDVVDMSKISRAKFYSFVKNYDILVVGLGCRIDDCVLNKATKLKIIATPTTGLDHIDLNYAKSRNIKVLSLKGETEFLSKITGTAELAFGLMINLMRKIPVAFESVKKGEWDREMFIGNNIYKKTIGIIGMGRLGRLMAQYSEAFGMEILFYDPYVNKNSKIKCEKVNFKELLGKSDVVSLHVPLNEETEHMIDYGALKNMKKQSYLINTSRGKVVNEKDLLKALKENLIAGYATDVLDGEPFTDNKRVKHALIGYANKHNNVIIVPHIGGMTFESRIATDIFLAEKIVESICKMAEM